MKIGYARALSEEQNLDPQIEALTAAGCDRIVTERGQIGQPTSKTRTEFFEAMDLLGPGDQLIVWRLDRLGASITDLVNLLETFEERGIEFLSLSDGIDTTSAGGSSVFRIVGALAEFERNLIRERTRASLGAAKKSGKRLGRPPALTPTQIEHVKAAISTKRATVTGMAEILGVNRSTIQRALGASF